MDNPSKIKNADESLFFYADCRLYMRGVDRSGLNPPASRKAEPFENPARFYGAVQYARYFVEGGGNRGYQ